MHGSMPPQRPSAQRPSARRVDGFLILIYFIFAIAVAIAAMIGG